MKKTGDFIPPPLCCLLEQLPKGYLAEDTNCEVVLTKHGYTVMQWDEKFKDWHGVEYCELPKIYEMNFSGSIA